jgi:hypothetical protein
MPGIHPLDQTAMDDFATGPRRARSLARRASAPPLLLAALLASACGALPVAQMALPDTLANAAPVPLEGLKAARNGSFNLAGTPGRFERSADRLSLFDALVHDRVGAGYTLSPGQAGAVSAACRARQLEGSIGIVSAAVRPYGVRCQFQGGWTGELVLDEVKAAAGTRRERSGRLQGGGVTLELRSVHRVQGSPLPLEAPIGYLISAAGEPVGAVEINGSTPRVWRPVQAGPLQDGVTHAAIALALLWDPAQQSP